MDGTKLMQLIKLIILGVAWFIVGVASSLPYWFKMTVKISVDMGKTEQDHTLDVGLFYMDQGKAEMMDLIFVEKASNAHTFPGMFRVAQIFYGIGGSSILVCFVISCIYFCRKYRSTTGEMCLASALLPTSCCITLGVVFALLTAVVDMGVWESFPVPDHYMIVEAKPRIAISYGLYVAAVGAVLSIVGTIFAWMQACTLCKHMEQVRYHMLHAPLTEDERGLPVGGPQYRGASSQGGFRYDGGYSKQGRGEMDF